MSKSDGLTDGATWLFQMERPGKLGIAVSGGGDSIALLSILAPWAKAKDIPVYAVTVDHGLRAEAADEAQFVADLCQQLDVPHEVLGWQGWDGAGNLQDQARQARYRLITEWAQVLGVDTVALGHTMDDQAETFLMRLMRGSGVDGLAAMKAERVENGVRWVRPFISDRREALRDYLREIGQGWIDDPTNEDVKFDRIKVRQALDVLDGLGITTEGLSDTAFRMGLARTALERFAETAAHRCCRVDGGDVIIQRKELIESPYEIQLRLVAHALGWVAQAKYRPRLLALQETLADVICGKQRTLHGCLITPKKSEIRISREHQAVKDVICPTDAIWDNRWQVSGPHAKGLELRALGEAGLAQCPDWRETGAPRASLLATPAVWQNQALIAAPLAGLSNGWVTSARFGADHFISTILSH